MSRARVQMEWQCRDAVAGAQADITTVVGALQELDAFLATALGRIEYEFTPQGALDSLRGLHISGDEVRRALQGTPNDNSMPQEIIDRIAAILQEVPRFAWLIREYRLDAFESVALLIALAPEIDLRYQRIYAYLQDDVTRKRPTVDLMLNLLCASDVERIECRRAFASNSALVRNDLVQCISDPNYVNPPLLAQYVKPDEQVVRLLVGDGGLDCRLSEIACLMEPLASIAQLPVSCEIRRTLATVAHAGARVHLWLHGPIGVKKGEAAEAVAAEQGRRLLEIDASQLDSARFQDLVRLAVRDASLRGAILYIAGLEAALQDLRAVQAFAATIRNATCSLIVGSTQAPPAAMLGVMLPVAMPVPCASVRSECWRKAITQRRIDVDERAVTDLGGRFSLTPAQIDSAAAAAALQAQAGSREPDLFAAARAQCGEALATVADKIRPQATWQDLVVPEDTITQLRELCQRVEHRDRVLEEWGFGWKLSRGRGTAALFSGGSGTGKTMAAEVIANALGLDLYRIDLARVVSKYIGDTEKNLSRIFDAAEGANAILFFDEADALFGKRSEVKDAHDRYANLEISYLLQQMEQCEGIAILATNLREHLDDAFLRRLAFTVHFPLPDEEHRCLLWSRIWPSATALANDVDTRALARQFKLSGGNIKNIALAASFLAASEADTVSMEHIVRATQREYQKLGKSLSFMEAPATARGNAEIGMSSARDAGSGA